MKAALAKAGAPWQHHLIYQSIDSVSSLLLDGAMADMALASVCSSAGMSELMHDPEDLPIRQQISSSHPSCWRLGAETELIR